MNAQLKRQPRPRKPIYFRVARVILPETGETVGALLPLNQWDQRAMRERKYHTGAEVRAELKRSRNVKFHRLAHALGSLLVDQTDQFEGLDAHAAIKRVQRECGVCCDEMTIELPNLGRLAVKMPRSIAFDEMDEAEFSQLFTECCRYISAHYLRGMSEDAIAEAVEMMAGTDA